MLQGFLPMYIGIVVHEVVVIVFPVRLCEVVGKLAVRGGSCLLAGIYAGLIKRDGVEGGEHAEIRQDWRIVFAVAIAVGGNVHGEIDMEAGTVLADSLRIFRHFAVQQVAGVPLLVADGIVGAGTNATAAALADVLVDMRLVVFIGDGARTAFLCTAAASTAKLFVHDDLARGMLLHLARAAAAAHADILERSAEAGHFMPFEMRKADEDIRIHDGAADFRGLHIFAVLDGDIHFIRSAQTVADDDLAARRDGIEAVEIRAVHMLQRMLAAAGIECIAIREEWSAALLLDQISNHLCVLRAQKSEIAQLTKMHLDGNKFSIHVDFFDARGQTEIAQLLREARADLNPEIRKINL